MNRTFEEVYFESKMVLLLESLQLNSGKDVMKSILNNDESLLMACRLAKFPEFYKDHDFSKEFDKVINYIKSFGSEEANPIQAVLLLIRKIETARMFEEVVNSNGLLDALFQYARGAKNTKIKKSEAYKAVMDKPFSVEAWHTLEKVGMQISDASESKIIQTSKEDSFNYDVLFDNGEWKLFVPHDFEADSHLAGGLVEFDCINSSGRKSVTTKAQWCTAANKSFYENYSQDGNCFYIVKHYISKNVADDAFQIAFYERKHVEIKDKFDYDIWMQPGESNLSILFERAPKELLAKIVNDNPNCDVKNSLLDYVEMNKMLENNEWLKINDLIFIERKAIKNYLETGYFVWLPKSKIPTFVNKIKISEGVTSIGESALYHCTSLTEINIPDSVISIGVSAFEGCSSLKYINIPNNVDYISDYAFYGCESLTSITIPDSVTEIGNEAFKLCTSLTDVTIGNGLTYIGDRAFEDCKNLTSINIPDSVTTINRNTFAVCRGLAKVTLGNNVTSIGRAAFIDCSSLTEINIPDSVTSIGDEAFYGCGKLTIHTTSDYVKKYCDRDSINYDSNVVKINHDEFFESIYRNA